MKWLPTLVDAFCKLFVWPTLKESERSSDYVCLLQMRKEKLHKNIQLPTCYMHNNQNFYSTYMAMLVKLNCVSFLVSFLGTNRFLSLFICLIENNLK